MSSSEGGSSVPTNRDATSSTNSYFSQRSQDSNARSHPTLQRATSIKEQAAKFFGVPQAIGTEDAVEASDISWQRKRFRHLNQQYGIKSNAIASTVATPVVDNLDAIVSALRDPSTPGYSASGKPARTHTDKERISRAFSTDVRPQSDRRDSVLQMAMTTAVNIVRGLDMPVYYVSASQGLFRTPSGRRVNRSPTSISIRSRGRSILQANRSFPTPPALQCVTEASQEQETSFSGPDRPDIDSDYDNVAVSKPRTRKEGLRRVNAMDFYDESPVVLVRDPSSPTRPDSLPTSPRKQLTRVSFLPGYKHDSVQDEQIPLSAMSPPRPTPDTEVFFDFDAARRPTFHIDAGPEVPMVAPSMEPVVPQTPASFPTRQERRAFLMEREKHVSLQEKLTLMQKLRRSFRERFTRVEGRSLSGMIRDYRSKRRRKPTLSKLPFGGSFKESNISDAHVQQQLNNPFIDERPFFTYWITFIQIVVMIMALARYGLGTSFTSKYFDVTERSGDVLAPSLSSLHLVVFEQNNIWIGPRYADLVHMGAKYSPCMRKDAKISELITEERLRESTETGCCVSRDGCYQTSDCGRQFSEFIKYTNSSRSGVVRAVCGQDPRYCKNPASVEPHRWNKDISQWPICSEPTESTLIPASERHLKCPLRGRPCCIQMHGQCRITTKEYCDFVRGHYHENATLCSQVSCLSDVCGMTPFMLRDHPDQYYRFVTPLFIHAGIIPCMITVWIQYFYMRKFEMLIGWLRLAIIYFGSGIAGYLASAIFMPFMPQVGPGGAQAGVLAAMTFNVIYHWDYLKNPALALMCHIAVAVLLFIIGFLPYIDNFGQIFGYVVGTLLALAIIPYFSVCKRLVMVVFALIAVAVIVVLLVIVFFVVKSDDLPDISYLSCISVIISAESRICDQQSLKLKDWLPI